MASGSYKNPFEMTECYFDIKAQHDALAQLLVPDERMWMVLDCKGGGTGYVGITDQRLLFRDAQWRKSRNVVVSVPLSRIHAVGISSDVNILGRTNAKISIQAGNDDWEFEFKNSEKTSAAYKLLMHLLFNRSATTE